MKFQPIIKWTGSKRALSEEIVRHFPSSMDTYYEPFCGSCSVLFQLVHSGIHIKEYRCSDRNESLIDFFCTLRDDPKRLYIEYKKRWDILYDLKSVEDKKQFFYEIRNRYNESKNVFDFNFLSRTAYNGLIRYNRKGEFNSPYHMHRNGIVPSKFKKLVQEWSRVLNSNNVKFRACSFEDIRPSEKDFVFLDPPYQNSEGIYNGNIDLKFLFKWIRNLPCRCALTFSGIRNDKDCAYPIPKDVFFKKISLSSKSSSFGTLVGKSASVVENLYLGDVVSRQSKEV